MRRIVITASLVLTLRAEVLDRVAIIVGREVITEQQVDEEIRVTDFMNRVPVSLDALERRVAAQRLVDQILVRREMETSHYPLPTDAEVDQFAAGVQESFGTAQKFESVLKTDDLTLPILKEHLSLQLGVLRFIEFRFKPEVSVSEEAIVEAYKKEEAQLLNGRTSLSQASEEDRERIRRSLAEKQTDELFEAWLKRNRGLVNISLLDQSLR